MDVKDFISQIPIQFVFEKLGIPKEMWPTTTTVPTAQSEVSTVNDKLKNISMQNLNRILSVAAKYQRGVLTYNQALLFIQGYGLTPTEAAEFLVTPEEEAPLPQPTAMSSDEEEDYIVGIFDEYGDSREDFEVLKSKKVCFSEVEEAVEDEEVFVQEAFKTIDVTKTEAEILELIRKDPKITPEVIAKAVAQTTKFVKSKISSLVKRGYLETSVEKIGADEIISRVIPEVVDVIKPPTDSENKPAQISVRYSYEVKPGIGPPIIENTRKFCIKMIQLNRLYTRADIEKISLRLGYSVWDRKGGWWGKSPECRHRWVSSIVVKK